ncbi:MAG: mersacidin/lichenicidin family type 2 lantibiotic [Planctomycetes bacterium]|nr:mersacidin/lichenicidin family type 2 lantibiotic [Planctomycetota bacterium]
MSPSDIIRAWKDEAFRKSLSPAERALLPENPAGMIELSEVELDDVSGARGNLNPNQVSTRVKNTAPGSGCGTGTGGGNGTGMGTGGNCTKCKGGCKRTFNIQCRIGTTTVKYSTLNQ